MTGWALCWNGSYPGTRTDWNPGDIAVDYRDNTWHQLVHRWDNGTCDTFVDAVKLSTSTTMAWKFDGDGNPVFTSPLSIVSDWMADKNVRAIEEIC